MSNNVIISQLDAEIIDYLTTCHDYCDSYDIARVVGINRRQVRSEIANVKEILSVLGYTLDSRRSKGYRILERDRITALQDYIRKSSHGDQSFFTPSGRRDFMMETLVMNDERYIRLDDLADSLFVSRSTINNDLQVLTRIIETRGCTVETKPRQGIRLIGSEKNKRVLLCDCLYNINTQNNTHSSFLELFMNPQSVLENSILQTLISQNIVMSDLAMCDFLLYLTVVCLRVRAGKMLEESPDVSMLRGRKEFDTAALIAVRISQYLDILLNEHEVNQIAVKIITNQSSTMLAERYYPELTNRITEECRTQIFAMTGIRLEEHPYIEQFINYIDTALTILSMHEKVRNPFYQTIRESYPLAYDLALIVKSVFLDQCGYVLSSSFMAYFTVFFNTWIQSKRYRPRRTLLLSSLGVGAANSINTELMLHFSSELEVKRVASYYELPSIDLNDFDLVLSTMPILRHLNIPSVEISQFMNNDDLRKIESTVTSDYSVFQPELACCPSLFISGITYNNPEAIRDIFSAKITNLFPNLKKSYVDTILASDQNYLTDLQNGFMFCRLEKPLNNLSFAVVLLLKEPIPHGEYKIRAMVMVSSDDRRFYRALREASRAIPEQELIEITDKKNPDYAEFIKLYHEEWD
ncbi:MAG: PRD domain-containing protein [Erysipelotrichaceae bacterium]|nr:PRD domain-containing protein [Erysipelotrichaceae bacterium]